jgi:NADH-quinone oxidoreductase subunit H
VEYSLKFALFFMAEYAHMIVVGALVATLFLGGWRGPVLPGVIWFLLKVFAILFLFIWVRATFPRFRYDQLMKFGWKVLFPLTIINLLITSLVVSLK